MSKQQTREQYMLTFEMGPLLKKAGRVVFERIVAS